jgi:hypothetical protein
MVGSVTQSGQQQFAAASKIDIAQAGFGQAVQNRAVLVAGKVTKAKVAEYKFPYQPNELIGVFGDRKQYRVTMPDAKSFSINYDRDGFNPMSNMKPADRLDPKDPVRQKQLVPMRILVNGEMVDTNIWSQPTKTQVIETLTRAFKDKDGFKFYGPERDDYKNDMRNIALPAGQKADGTGKHIKGDKVSYDAKDYQFIYRGFIRKLGQDVAARGGIPFSSIDINNLGSNQLSYTPSNNLESLNFLVDDLTQRNILTKGGKLTVKTSPSSNELSYSANVDDTHRDENQIGYLAHASRKNNVEINLIHNSESYYVRKEYTFKPNGTAWLNGAQIVTSTLMRDQNKK